MPDTMTSMFMPSDMPYPFGNSASVVELGICQLETGLSPPSSRPLPRVLSNSRSALPKYPNSKVCALGMLVITGRHNCGIPGGFPSLTIRSAQLAS